MSAPKAAAMNWLEHTSVVYFDLETTGLNTDTAETIELAAEIDPECRSFGTKQGSASNLPELSGTFSSLICPDSGVIPDEASRINGIYMDAVKDQPLFGVVALQFMEWLRGWKQRSSLTCKRVVILAHNNLKYDSLILKRQCQIHNVVIPDFVVFGDSLIVMRECFFHPARRYALAKLAASWVPKTQQQKQDHRAGSDVKLLMLVIQKCPDKIEFFDTLMRQLAAA
jgi:DNA polymerase III epsilon subunit-like protein